MGERFIKSGDHAVILIFDEAGYIAGIQIGVSIALPPEVSCMHFIKSGKNLQKGYWDIKRIFFPNIIKVNSISTDNV
jgi:hypothetical protein